MRTAAAGVDLIKEFESCALTAYRDGNGIWTVGWGHIEGVAAGITITQEQAEAYFERDLLAVESTISRLVKAPVTQNQFDALVCFTYNVGAGHLENSTLLKMVNAAEYGRAARQFLAWDLVAGKPSPGLQRRRMRESTLFQTPMI